LNIYNKDTQFYPPASKKNIKIIRYHFRSVFRQSSFSRYLIVLINLWLIADSYHDT